MSGNTLAFEESDLEQTKIMSKISYTFMSAPRANQLICLIIWGQLTVIYNQAGKEKQTQKGKRSLTSATATLT